MSPPAPKPSPRPVVLAYPSAMVSREHRAPPPRLARNGFSETFLLPPAYASFPLQAVPHGRRSATGTHLCKFLSGSAQHFDSSDSATCPVKQAACFQRLTDSSSLWPLFFKLLPFVFKHLRTLLSKQGVWGTPRTDPSRIYQWARMRYFRTEVPFLSTGTLNWAANAAVLLNLYVDESISQSPPMGSLTSTVIGLSL
jgi:hypothetical protein